MKMRELEQRTGISRQMVHYYLSNGMIPEPERPKKNVAIYSEKHVAAIQSIRQLQTQSRLSIEEIKKILAGKSAETATAASAFNHLDELFASHAGVDKRLVLLSSVESRNRQAATDAKVLQQVGAITLVKKGGEVFLSHIDAQIVAYWGDMRATGFTEEAGFTPELVSMHVDSAQRLAKDEVDAFMSRVSPEYSAEDKAAMAQAGSKITLELFTLLRLKATVEAFKRAN
jgi:DNA-binding transcriptional MerR regulator